MTAESPRRSELSSNAVLRRALNYGALLALAIAIVMGVIGAIVAGWPGIVSALVGTAMALVFLGITAASILVANRFSNSDMFVGAFFGIVLGSWFLKFIVFIVLSLVLKGQSWISPSILFISIVLGVIGSLLVDVIVVARSRLPYVSDMAQPHKTGDSLQPSDSDEPGAKGTDAENVTKPAEDPHD